MHVLVVCFRNSKENWTKIWGTRPRILYLLSVVSLQMAYRLGPKVLNQLRFFWICSSQGNLNLWSSLNHSFHWPDPLTAPYSPSNNLRHQCAIFLSSYFLLNRSDWSNKFMDHNSSDNNNNSHSSPQTSEHSVNCYQYHPHHDQITIVAVEPSLGEETQRLISESITVRVTIRLSHKVCAPNIFILNYKWPDDCWYWELDWLIDWFVCCN